MVAWSVHALERFDQRFPNRKLSNLPYEMIERHSSMQGERDEFSVTFCEITFKCMKFGHGRTLIKTVHHKSEMAKDFVQDSIRVPRPYKREKQRWELHIEF